MDMFTDGARLDLGIVIAVICLYPTRGRDEHRCRLAS
jgi:hypothetical protein